MFNIIIKDDLWISSMSDNLATTFYLEIGELYFPSEKWSDLTHPILEIWSYQLLQYKNVGKSKFKLYFMDGSYRLDLEKNGDELIVKCVEFGFRDFLICTQFTCEYMTFLKVVYNAVKQFVFFLYQLSEKDVRWEKVYESYIFLRGELKRAIRE